jgi:cytoskeletal protein CcmA (bactofilin family)
MNVFDNKTEGIIESNGQFILPAFNPCDNATFKASYVVASDIECTGKITALFDLTVLGNVEANEIDIKGKFICIGNCVVSGTIIAQHDIWVDDIQANSIECRERIIANDIDADVVKADSDIIVGKCLAVEKLAHSGNNVICGETVYGAGKVVASIVVTGEPIDLDDGEDAVVNPNIYNIPSTVSTPVLVANNVSSTGNTSEFSRDGDWLEYLDWLIDNSLVESAKNRFLSWKETLSKADGLIRTGISDYRDLKLLIWIADIASSDYFHEWSQVQSLFKAIDQHFAFIVSVDITSLLCQLESYSELLLALNILNRCGILIDAKVYSVALDMLISNFGLKLKFLAERLNEKGWSAYG